MFLVKGIVHQKMKILSLITHPDVVPNLKDLRSSSEHKLRYFRWTPRAFWPFIDSKDPYTIKVQKHSKDIFKIVHVTVSGSTVILQSYKNHFSVQRKQK